MSAFGFREKAREKLGQRRKRFLEHMRSLFCSACHRLLSLHKDGVCPKDQPE